jgi:hypothetical protein
MHPGGEHLIAPLRWRALALLSAASFAASWAILVIVHRLCS